MKIEVLYFDGCPNHVAAVARLREVLKEERVAAEIVEVNVADPTEAQAVGFLGSPSIRINGVDVEPAARSGHEAGMSCRTYLEDGRREGIPSRELVRAAVRESLVQQSKTDTPSETRFGSSMADSAESNRSLPLLMSSVIAAIVASFCCILPIVFALTGFTVVGASAAFAEWRPYLLALTFGLLGLGFYFAYRPAKAECGPDGVCARPFPRRSGRLMLWLAAAAVVAFSAFPYFSGTVAELLLPQSNSATIQPGQNVPRVQHANLAIQGMDCSSCAMAIENKLKAVPGVHDAKVSFQHGTADVDYESGLASIEQLKRAVQEAGYLVLN